MKLAHTMTMALALLSLSFEMLESGEVSAALLDEERVSPHIRITTEEGSPEEPQDGKGAQIVLRAMRLGDREMADLREWTVDLPWQGWLDLDRRTSWQLDIAAPGFWAAPKILPSSSETPASATEPMEIRLFPTGELSGRISLAVPSQQLPDELGVEFQNAPLQQPESSDESEEIPRSHVMCPVVDRVWRCELPAGIWDLRLNAEGLVPHYFWGVVIEKHKKIELGEVRLAAGASVVGWASLDDREPEDELRLSIRIEPQIIGWQRDPSERQRLAALPLTTTTGPRGFFQLKGVAPGSYTLTASRPGFASEQIFPLTVEEDREIVLEDPIVLHRPLTLEVVIEPAVDSHGQPWMVQLSERRSLSSYYEVLSEAPATIEGFFKQDGLSSGELDLKISDTSGSIWLSEKVAVEAPGETFFATIPLVPIKGTVSIGDEPLAATLSFGSTQGQRDIRLASDEKGRFAGYLPEEGIWPVEIVTDPEAAVVHAIEPVEVRRRPGKSTVELELALPDTRLSGEVVTEGEPVPGAFVLLMRDGEEKKRREAMVTTDEKGRFELRGLSLGPVLVHAYHQDSASPWMQLELHEGGSGSHARLELSKKIEISGIIMSPFGPVPGAEIAAWPQSASALFQFLARTTSRADGTFVFSLPAQAPVADLLVIPPGFATKMLRFPLVAGKTQDLILNVESERGSLTLLSGSSEKAGNPQVDLVTLQYEDGTSWQVDLLHPILFVVDKLSFRGDGMVLADMAAGRYSLCTGSAGSQPRCSAGFLSPGGSLVLGSGGTE